MSLGSLRDLYLDELSGLYDAESQLIRALPRFMEQARDPELRGVLHKHCLESRLHLDRLQLIFTHWGERVVPRACSGIAGIVQEADDRLHEPATPDTRDAAIIGATQRLAHYEIATYGCARSYARRLNRPDEARLLQETLDEETRADRWLTGLAEAGINDNARREADLHEERRTRLGYVAESQLDHSALREGPLEVRNAAGEDLGEFDGLVIELPTKRPVYIVVDASGLFGSWRYLLPVAQVRFDAGACTLLVNLNKDVAERYPSFDPEKFTHMSPEQIGRYERQLLEFFPGPADPLPDWLASISALTPGRERQAGALARDKAAERSIR